MDYEHDGLGFHRVFAGINFFGPSCNPLEDGLTGVGPIGSKNAYLPGGLSIGHMGCMDMGLNGENEWVG